jgi:hypothetical protein
MTTTTTMLEKLQYAGRFSPNPQYSLFRVSSYGGYALILQTSHAELIVEQFDSEMEEGYPCSLEIRCNGVRVDG